MDHILSFAHVVQMYITLKVNMIFAKQVSQLSYIKSNSVIWNNLNAIYYNAILENFAKYK